MRNWLAENLAEAHAYGGIFFAAIGIGFLVYEAGWAIAAVGAALLVLGTGLFYLAGAIDRARSSSKPHQERPRAVA